MGDINDMVVDIAKGDLGSAQKHFNDVLGDKIAGRLDQEKANVASKPLRCRRCCSHNTVRSRTLPPPYNPARNKREPTCCGIPL